MIDNIKRKRLESLAPLVLAMLLAPLIYSFNLQVIGEKAKELESSVKNKRDSIEVLSRLALNPTEQRVIEEGVAKERLRLESIIPSQIQLTNFLRNLEILVWENQINLNNFSPQKVIIEEDYVKIPIRLSFIADYKKIITFFSKLEEINRLVTIDNLIIAKDKDNNLKVDTLIYIYSLEGQVNKGE